jgi:hypothetical protein
MKKIQKTVKCLLWFFPSDESPVYEPKEVSVTICYTKKQLRELFNLWVKYKNKRILAPAWALYLNTSANKAYMKEINEQYRMHEEEKTRYNNFKASREDKIKPLINYT